MIYAEYDEKTKLITRIFSAQIQPLPQTGCSIRPFDENASVNIGEHIDSIGLGLKEKIEKGFITLADTETYDEEQGYIRNLNADELLEKYPERFPVVMNEYLDPRATLQQQEYELRAEIRNMQDLEGITYSSEEIKKKQLQLAAILERIGELDK